ncbi:MAG: sigma 54-interacting transcriptional regulator [Thermodesulfobacteriota bacterium]|nr:sigma 54-interacting transcriptional regulator [Thermodesulfobacteriota bacterium]
MSVDEKEFFREATIRICGTLDVERALDNCFSYLKAFIDLDTIYLHYFDPQQASTVVLAEAGHQGGQKRDVAVAIEPELMKIIKHNEMPDLQLMNRANNHSIGKLILQSAGVADPCSIILMRLVVDDEWLGGVTIAAYGWDRFTENDLALISHLKVPFGIALANSRRYQELLKLKHQLADDKEYLRHELEKQTGHEIIGQDGGLSLVVEQVYRVAPLSTPVLLLGETGVGKEVIANTIHRLSTRHNGNFIKVNCGAIPENLIDSELFGHEKGAFTGAVERKRGRFERAHQGSIFLDEIGELSMDMQVRLLRVLQEQEFDLVGADKSVRVDVRVVAATHRDLAAMVAENRFREDLYFRLTVFPVYVPPLRERKEDIPALTQHFIREKHRQLGGGVYPTLAPGALERLQAYDWPGNVRELENAIEREIIISAGDPLQFKHLDPQNRGKAGHPHSAGENSPPLPLNDVVYRHITSVLEQTGGKVDGTDGAAAVLGVNPSTLRHKMRKMGIPFGRKQRAG